jgi:competence protein ComEC
LNVPGKGYWSLLLHSCSSEARKRYPGIVLLLIIVPSLLLAAWCRPPGFILLMLLIGLLILTAVGTVFGAQWSWIADILFLLLLVCAVLFTFSVHAQFPVIDDTLHTKPVQLGVVESNPVQEQEQCVFTVRLIDPRRQCVLPYRMLVYTESVCNQPAYGDVVALNGSVRIPSCSRNPGGFDARASLLRKGVHYRMYASGGEVHYVAHGMLNPFRQWILYPTKALCTRIIQERLARPYSSLLLGLTVGQRGDVPEEIRSIFSDAGIVHILAVSGLHVGILSFFLLMLFRSLGIRFECAIGITCILIILYALLVDLRAPVIRATIMFVFIMLGLLMQKRIVLVNIVACSAVLMLIFRPYDIFDPGFQLSYAATFSIVMVHQHLIPFFPRWMRAQRVVRNYIVLPFAVSLSAQLGTAPIVAFHFFRCSVIAPISNIIMVPFVFLAIPVGFLMVGGTLIHPLLGRIFAGASWFFLHCIIRLSDMLASIPHSALWVRRPGVTFFVLYYATMLSFVITKGRRRIVTLSVMALLSLNVIVYARLWNSFHPRMYVHFLDVGQGDAMVVEFPDGKTAVIDGGTRNAFVDYGERVLLPFLRSKGIRKLHTVVATHPDVDHYGGLLSLLEEMEVGCLLVNGEHKPSMLYRALLETAKKRAIPVFAVHRGQVVHVGITPLYVLHPPSYSHHRVPSSNERSVVLKCGYGTTSLLLTGDYANGFMPIPSWCLGSTVLKFPHHGAPLAGVYGFVNDVKPRISVISVGKGNPFGHPHPLNQHVLMLQGSSVYRTDRQGAISIGADGSTTVTETAIP